MLISWNSNSCKIVRNANGNFISLLPVWERNTVMSVCLSACIYQEPQIQTTPNFQCTLPVAKALSPSPDGITIHYVFLVLCIMMPYFPIMALSCRTTLQEPLCNTQANTLLSGIGCTRWRQVPRLAESFIKGHSVCFWCYESSSACE